MPPPFHNHARLRFTYVLDVRNTGRADMQPDDARACVGVRALRTGLTGKLTFAATVRYTAQNIYS